MARANTNKPLGVQPAKGPAAQNNAVQVTDNSSGWAAVGNIPVPPTAEKRDFKKPLGLSPVLVNGGVIPQKIAAESNPEELPRGEEPASIDLDKSSLPNPLSGLSESKTSAGLSFTNQSREYKSVEIDWYGAKLSLNCLNAVYQSPDPKRGNQGWLLLELPLDSKTGNPPWRPPIAQLGEDGKISVPEFDCNLDFEKLRCQILNIEIYDRLNRKYVVVLRVLNSSI